MLSVVDPQGRYIFLICTIAGLECIIANIYIPPPFSTGVLKILASFLAHHPHTPVLVVGEFKNFLDAGLDTFSVSFQNQQLPDGPTPFARLLMEMGLQDVWRIRKPQSRTFSGYSASHRAYLEFISAFAKRKCSPIYLNPSCNLSDHSPFWAQVVTSSISKKKKKTIGK